MVILFFTALLLLLALVSVITAHRLAHPPRKTYAVALARELPTDPYAAGLNGEPCRFDLPDGRWAEGFDMAGRDPGGPVVIFTHGWSDSRYGALTWAAGMADVVARVVVYDLRGHGDSPAPCSHLGSREAEDLLAIVDQVAAGGPGTARPLVLWGHSLGALVTLRAAAVAADREGNAIDGVVVDGVIDRFREAVAGRLRLMRLPAPVLAPLAMAWLSLWDARAVRLRATRAAAAVTCPLLVLHGRADAIAPLTSARAVAAAHRDARLVVFDEGGHGNLAVCDAERYRAALTEFFDDAIPWTSPRASTTPC